MGGLPSNADGSITLDAGQVRRYQEFQSLLDRSSTEMLEFTGELRGQLMDGKSGIRAFDLSELVRNLARNVGTAHGVDIACDLPSQPVTMSGSPYPWIQMMENILCNGLDEAGPGGQLWASMKADPEEVVLTLGNNGPPIANCQACAFEHRCLEQKCGTFVLGKTTKPGGSGTGMVTVLDTLQKLGGTLKIESGPGATTFELRVPLTTLK